MHPSAGTNTDFGESVLGSLDVRFLDPKEIEQQHTVAQYFYEMKPDVVVVSGWWNPGYRKLLRLARHEGSAVVLAMDNPFHTSTRAFARRLRSWRLFNDVDFVVVPGERAMRLAHSLGFSPRQVHVGLYGVDRTKLSPALAMRELGAWPRRFLFLGQLTPKKGFDLLLSGYSEYHQQAAAPWLLTVCGAGPLQRSTENLPGVEYRGFVHPSDHLSLFASHGALLLPSRFDPWPLVIVEAAAAGLPILCSTACGSAVEVVRDRYSGRVMPCERPADVAAGLRWLVERSHELPTMGQRSARLAEPYSAEMWAQRWADILAAAVDERRRRG